LKLENLKEKIVLYVEDDKAVIRSFLPILKKLFKTVYLAENGIDGLELFKEKKDINFVISDIKMPKMDGLEMSKLIKEIDPSVPCIITTAHAEYDYFSKANDIGIYRYITKPINIEELFEAMDDFDSGLIVEKIDL
jgi:YesN/AraC family two-component response regulator